jgi:hypothetical protein
MGFAADEQATETDPVPEFHFIWSDHPVLKLHLKSNACCKPFQDVQKEF